MIACYIYFVLDWQAKPLCHKQLLLGLENWLDQNRATIAPNVNGRSDDSFAAMSKELGDEVDRQWPTQYRYVPGLQKGDPGDLVLAYFVQPTRYQHHATQPTVFDEKSWIIIPLDFTGFCSLTQGQGGREMEATGECSENVSLAVFRRRLTKTLDYLRDNERPHWETVVEEHSKFLDSIPKN